MIFQVIILVLFSMIHWFVETSSLPVRKKRNSNRNNNNNNNETGPQTFQFVIPRNDPANSCIKLETALIFQATYTVDVDATTTRNRSIEFNLVESDNFTYTGYCQPDKTMIEIMFLNDWRLELYFYKMPTTFLFNHVVLYYKLSGQLFPESIHDGAQSEVYDIAYINSSLQKSYSCKHGFRVDLDEVSIYFKNFHIEPHFNNRPNQPFEHEITCEADHFKWSSTDTNAWLISLAVFFCFLILCCFLFIYCKLKTNRNESDNKRYDPMLYE